MTDPRPVLDPQLRSPLVVSPEIELEGKYVRLEPMRPEHAEELFAVGDIAEIFRWMPRVVRDVVGMRDYIETAMAERAAGTSVPFVTIDKITRRVIGSTRFMNIDRANRGLEIGSTWLGKLHQRTHANSEAKYLMLKHAFDRLGAIRVEFKTDSFNEKSRAALLRLGAKEEGARRHHVITADGRLRDSVYFSILRDEWPEIRVRLETRL